MGSPGREGQGGSSRDSILHQSERGRPRDVRQQPDRCGLTAASSACPDIPTSRYPNVPISRCPDHCHQGQHSCPNTTRVNKCCVAPTPPCPSRAGSPRVPAPSKPSAAPISHKEKMNPSTTAHRHRFVSPRWWENQQTPGVLLLSHLIIMNICWWPLPRWGRAGGSLASGFFQRKNINGDKIWRVLLVPKPGVTQHSQHGFARGE